MHEGNALGGQKFHKKLTKAFPDDEIVIKSCISMCKTCKKQLLATVDGVKMRGKSIGKIIGKIENL